MRGAYLNVRSSMMQRGSPSILGMIIVLVVTLAVLHTAGHFALYGTGIKSLGESGVSGFAVGGKDIEEIKTNYSQVSLVSKGIIIGEWSLLVVLVLVSIMKDRIHMPAKGEHIEIKKTKAKSETDIDVLYNVLKEKKTLKISTIKETFNIKEEIAMEWAKILEEADLVTIAYPRFGEAEVKIKE